MRNLTKWIRRFAGILSLSIFLLLAVNLLILILVAAGQSPNSGPWTTARTVSDSLIQTADGYRLSEEAEAELRDKNAWAIYISDTTKQVVWQTEDCPPEIAQEYTIAQIAGLTRGYLADYPTFTAGTEDGLVVVGFPKDSYWKMMNPSWDLDFIKNAPYLVLAVFGVNITVIFLIYIIANSRLLRSIQPLANGIQALPGGAAIHVREQGLLSDLANDINKTAEILQSQRLALQKKETARANWISGVSHDIRTPLSMVMGYAEQLAEDSALSPENRRKAHIMQQQSTKIKNLIADLNLSAKLEYQMQPLHLETCYPAAIIRQCAADFLNTDLDEKYPLSWEIPENQSGKAIHGDRNLLCRAVSNLLNNARTHNPAGCRITLKMEQTDLNCRITIADDGVGMTDEQLEQLKSRPLEGFTDEGLTEPRHGLGLLIVRQIVNAHHGTLTFSAVQPHGLCVCMSFPLNDNDNK